ncbi:hypothetical protein [uncultured Robinsoniella sp.]|uniref:hypothetical protein n=1 Tax=uncultured Robinsoniella sp. TaxID=904190 RepID=UPI00374F4658
MKEFIGEYGLIIVSVIIILLLVLLATPLGQYLGNAIVATVTNFITESGITSPPTITVPW